MTKADINRHIYTLTQPFPNAALKRYDNAPRLEADYEAARVYWSLGIGVAAPHFWPFSADAQQGERVRLIGVLLQAAKNDLESEARVKAFLHGLEQLGWTEGRNLKLEYRWAGGNSDDIRKHAAELVAPSRRISSWRLEAQQSGLCSRRRVLYRSCLRLLAIRSVAALSKA
ncbi:MAG: hypothetical protein WCB22_03115 [Pseudolabrys sp.]